MSRFSPQFLDELRQRTQLSTLVGRTLKLTRAGREWKACCPFHHEKSASFYVNDDKGFYHCFGCSAHGDAIGWMVEARGLAFVDAVKELADAAGLALPAPDPQAAARDARAAGLHDVMAAAAAWFAGQLQADAGVEARRYLSARGVTHTTVAAFGLGLAPDRRDALKIALARFGDAAMVEAGLLIEVEGKTPYDRFRGRLMIPIRDPRGRVIAFGGRILGAGEPKYLNSPDTPLFDKGRTLYNLDKAAAAARRPSTGSESRLIVVEGYLDVIALAQVGIEEAVAPLGTALTEAQLERLWRVVDVPVLCFDGDTAGRRAAVRAAERALPLLAPGRSLEIALLPADTDPDDLARSGGRAALDRVFAETQPLADLIWAHEVAASPLRTPEARAGLKRRLADRVDTISDRDIRALYREEFRQRYGRMFFAARAMPRVPWQPPGKRRPPVLPPDGRVRTIGGSGIDAMFARAIMIGLLRHPSMIATCAEPLSMLVIADPMLERLRTTLLEAAYDTPDVDSRQIDTISAQSGLTALVEDLRRTNGLAFSFARSEADPPVARRDLAMAIEAVAARPELDAALDAATARQASGADADGFAEQLRLIAARGEADDTLAALASGEDE